jgi:hypothetical protein
MILQMLLNNNKNQTPRNKTHSMILLPLLVVVHEAANKTRRLQDLE